MWAERDEAWDQLHSNETEKGILEPILAGMGILFRFERFPVTIPAAHKITKGLNCNPKDDDANTLRTIAAVLL